MSEIELADQFDQMNKIVSEFIKGNNVNAIAKKFDLKTIQVSNMLNTWREIMHSDTGIRERAKEALGAADQHYSMVINEAWNTVHQSDEQDDELEIEIHILIVEVGFTQSETDT